MYSSQKLISFFTLILIFIGLLLGFNTFFTNDTALNSSDPITLTPTSTPFAETILIATNIQQFDEQGKLANELSSQTIRIFPQQERNNTPAQTRYQHPEITLFQENAEPVFIQADRGYSDKQGNTLELVENVLIRQEQIDGLHRIETSKLTVHTETQFAETDKAVTITQPAGITTSVGLNAFFAEEKLELTSKVLGNYAP